MRLGPQAAPKAYDTHLQVAALFSFVWFDLIGCWLVKWIRPDAAERQLTKVHDNPRQLTTAHDNSRQLTTRMSSSIYQFLYAIVKFLLSNARYSASSLGMPCRRITLEVVIYSWRSSLYRRCVAEEPSQT